MMEVSKKWFNICTRLMKLPYQALHFHIRTSIRVVQILSHWFFFFKIVVHLLFLSPNTTLLRMHNKKICKWIPHKMWIVQETKITEESFWKVRGYYSKILYWLEVHFVSWEVVNNYILQLIWEKKSAIPGSGVTWMTVTVNCHIGLSHFVIKLRRF